MAVPTASRPPRSSRAGRRTRQAAGLTAIACVLALFVPSAAGARPTHRAAAAPTGLDQALHKLVADGVPGAMAIQRNAGHEWQDAVGVADLATGEPLSVSDRFRIGSITKSFVSTVVLQLVGEGRLNLGDTVERWLPGLVPNGSAITVQELLEQTSGLYDYADGDFYLHLLKNPLQTYQPTQLVQLAVAHPPLFAPGTGWGYSNTNYVLLGLIIDAVDSAPPVLQMADPALNVYARIVAPLGLAHTTFPLTNPDIIGPHTHGYVLNAPPDWGIPPVLDTTRENPSWGWTAGAIVSTLDDVADFHHALFTGRLLAPAQQHELETTIAVVPGLDYGAGVFKLQTPCGPAWGHDGGTPNAVSISLTSPDGSRQAVVMGNSDFLNTGTPNAAVDFTSAYLTAYCGYPISIGATPAARSAAMTVTATLASVAGTS